MKIKSLVLLILITILTHSEGFCQKGTSDTICIPRRELKKAVVELLEFDRLSHVYQLDIQKINLLESKIKSYDSLSIMYKNLYETEKDFSNYIKNKDELSQKENKRLYKKLNRTRNLSILNSTIAGLLGVIYLFYEK